MGEITHQQRELARQVPTPCFLYHLDVLVQQVNGLRHHLAEGMHLYYAVKANPNLGLLKRLLPLVDGVDIASSGEMEQARRAGFAPAAMSFAGPGKSLHELQQALDHQLGVLSLDSLAEAHQVAELARARGSKARVVIRVNPAREFAGYAIRMAGRPSPFGVDEEGLPSVVQEVLQLGEWLDLLGFHVYPGTQCLKGEAVEEHFAATLAMVETLIQAIPFPLRLINFGGGLGIPYHS
ncbi:MAG: pyridoxal-dependent decarboxylase, exosortase A system-associated, partial [Magnetococcales bacterium]|nr:pyridoxal-dependent decarboxylase, exosortase A system-associated [Magnetococcales bacterium]